MVSVTLKNCRCTPSYVCGPCADEEHYRIVVPKKDSKLALSTDSVVRKNTPVARGFMDYFPAAMAAVAQLSKAANEKHNPGEPMHHARGKSTDHADCILRHLMDRGEIDPEDNVRHSVKVAWRAMALLQEELEAAGEAPLARGARK